MSGHNAALDVVQAEAVKKGALKAARLAVSGAFHTPLMQPARDALVKARLCCTTSSSQSLALCMFGFRIACIVSQSGNAGRGTVCLVCMCQGGLSAAASRQCTISH